ncbi:MAG: hypothetical protein KC621_30100 [Myxococcales bacterium]|nr:hypothetical protein [Myxococcales bacterium]
MWALLLACAPEVGDPPVTPPELPSRVSAEAVDTAPERISVTRTSATGRSVVAGWEPEALGSRLLAVEADGRSRTLVDASWNADRPALSEDGALVAFVSGRSGIASVWVVPFEGGEPRQLTNVGMRRVKGQPGAPEGFVPPPVDDSLRFDGDALVWSGPERAHRVELP